jgi:hypothetical protein
MALRIALIFATGFLTPCVTTNADAPGHPTAAPVATTSKSPERSHARPALRRLSITVEPDKFREGWKQSFRVPGGDNYVATVQNGWLHVSKENDHQALD